MSGGVGIIYSRFSLVRNILDAQKAGGIYDFGGANGKQQWLKKHYAYLAPNGVASLLRRFCIKFDWIEEGTSLTQETLKKYHTLVLPNASALSNPSCQAIGEWVSHGGYLWVTDRTNLPFEILGLSSLERMQPLGYTALGIDDQLVIIGYRGYPVGVCQASPNSRVLASAREVRYPVQENRDAGIFLGDGVIQNGTVLYFALPLFETFGAMLQGHVNFEDIRAWGHRFKYLDWVGRVVKDLLQEAGWEHLWRVRMKPWGDHNGVIVLRHDVDSSTDTTYLDYEKENLIPATYAVLNDPSRQYWLEAATSHPAAEAAFHFDTTPDPLVQRFFPNQAITSAIQKTSKRGLWRQTRLATKVGIPIQTVQRHFGYFPYPEMVDALDYLYDHEKDILGAGTMFRFTNFMYGARSLQDQRTYAVQHPDTSAPFWFPFKLWYTSVNRHQALRGWDITSVVEPEPWLTDLLFNQIDYLEDGVYTLGFHPAHCWGKNFCPQGNWRWFEYAVQAGKAKNFLFSTCQDVFERLNQWEQIDFGFDVRTTEGLIINNVSSTSTVFLETSLNALRSHGEVQIDQVSERLYKIILPAGKALAF